MTGMGGDRIRRVLTAKRFQSTAKVQGNLSSSQATIGKPDNAVEASESVSGQ